MPRKMKTKKSRGDFRVLRNGNISDMDDINMQEHWKMHKKMMGCKMLVLGILVLANTYWNVFSWANFIGIILLIAGVMKLVGHCKCK